MRRLPLCVVLLAALGGSARPLLANARFPRVQPAPVPAPYTVRVLPPTPAAPAAAPTAPKPMLDVSSVLVFGTTPSNARPETEQILAKLIEETPDSDRDEKSDYLFRLGQYYSAQVRYWTVKSTELAALDVTKLTPAQRATNQTAANHAANLAKMSLLKAVKTYKGLTDNEAFRAYPKLDLALFDYGHTLQTGKYMKEARAVYDKLLKNFPDSIHIPYAHLLFGEYYFDAGQLADAEARYKMVLKFPKSDAYWYAMYKQGWIHLHLQHNPEALESFAQIVFATRNDASRKSLHDAALHDFVYAYAEVGKPDKAFAAFSRLDKNAAPRLVEQLAEILRARGKAASTMAAYREMVAATPADSHACQWQYSVARSTFWDPAATAEDKVREIETLVRVEVARNGNTFPPDRSAATDGGAAPTEARGVAAPGKPPVVDVADMDQDCLASAAAMASEVAAAYHVDGFKTRNDQTLAYAERLYTAYVTAFPDATPQREMRAEVAWLRAELETSSQLRWVRWERAAELFTAMGTEAGARAASRAWLNALDVAIPTDAKLTIGKAPRSARRALPIEPRKAKAIAALGALPNRPSAVDDEVVQSRLATAIVLRQHRHYDEAITVLDQLLEDQPTHASAELAANLMLDSLVQARSPDLPVVVSAMLADRAFVDTKPQLMKNLVALHGRSAR